MLNQIWRLIFCPFEVKILINGSVEQKFSIVRTLIKEQGFQKYQDTETNINFKCKSRDLIGWPYITTMYCTFLKTSNESMKLIITYKGFKQITLIIFAIPSLQLLIGAIIADKPIDKFLLLLSIPIILAIGSRVVFLAILPQAIKLRTFFKDKLFNYSV